MRYICAELTLTNEFDQINGYSMGEIYIIQGSLLSVI